MSPAADQVDPDTNDTSNPPRTRRRHASTGHARRGWRSRWTAIGAAVAEIRHLTVRNTGGPGEHAAAIATNGVQDGNVSILHVTAVAGGSDRNYGVLDIGSALTGEGTHLRLCRRPHPRLPGARSGLPTAALTTRRVTVLTS